MNRIEQLEKFIAEDGADLFSRYALALEYMKLENYDEAEKTFQFLAVNHPEYIATYFQYGKLLMTMSRSEEAKIIFRKGMDATRNTNQKTYSELQNELTNLELGIS